MSVPIVFSVVSLNPSLTPKVHYISILTLTTPLMKKKLKKLLKKSSTFTKKTYWPIILTFTKVFGTISGRAVKKIERCCCCVQSSERVKVSMF